jgi:RimJ/RimL family protein N-acetyltransferase
MRLQPTLETERLLLRPFRTADAPSVEELAGDRDVASTTRLIPHPYPRGLAEQWISTLPEKYQKQELVNFAITLKVDGAVIGSIGLILSPPDDHAELGYWVGKPYWNNGYCTEAAYAILTYAFRTLKLHRVFAKFMTRNPASGRVMEKLGMQQEGVFRQHRKKWGIYEDMIVCGVLKSEFRDDGHVEISARRRAKKT